MRLTCFSIVLALAFGLWVDRSVAQIPERVTFQPGSFAHGYRPGVAVPGVAMASAQPMQPTVAVVQTAAADEAEDDDAPKTEWEEKFGAKQAKEPEVVLVQVPTAAAGTASSKQTPYLAWHRNPWTGRIHLIPYQPGYADVPEQFPTHQSKLNLWLSSLPCREQNRPQQKYLSYYDPMPEVLTDKPSRCQLILGYDDPNWTASCQSPSGYRMAHCPGVDFAPVGPAAEARIVDQIRMNGPINGRGVLAGPAPYVGQMYANPRGAFGFQRGVMPPPCPPQPCPECVQQCPQCPPQPAPLPAPKNIEEPSCSTDNPCSNCTNKRPCVHQKSFRTLEKNSPKIIRKSKADCVGEWSEPAKSQTEMTAKLNELVK